MTEQLKTIDEWADTRRQVENFQLDEEGQAFTDFNGPGYIYEGGYIEGPVDGFYNLLICRTEWSSKSLERLEGILYSQWIMGEIYGVKVI